LDLTGAVELRPFLTNLGPAAAANADFPIMGGRPGSRNTTSAAMKLWTVSMSPAFVAIIRVATS